MAADFYSDAEVDELCAGLEQNAAKIRFLRDVCKLRVDRKPNGRPLAWRPAAPAAQDAPADSSIVVDLQGWAKRRKGRDGQKTQGR